MKTFKRIGIFGGTFNPIHHGHLHLARVAVNRLKLSKLYFVPTYLPPHKKIKCNIDPRHRASMVRLAIKGQRNFSLSRFEISRRGKSYSVRTIRYFRKQLGSGPALFLLIGADSLKGIDTWKDYKNVIKLAQIVVFERPGHSLKVCPPNIRVFRNYTPRNIASTTVRDLSLNGKSFKHLVPGLVHKYIKQHGLYRTQKTIDCGKRLSALSYWMTL